MAKRENKCMKWLLLRSCQYCSLKKAVFVPHAYIIVVSCPKRYATMSISMHTWGRTTTYFPYAQTASVEA